MRERICLQLFLSALMSGATSAQEEVRKTVSSPPIEAFLSEGFGTRDEKAPAETEQFGRLVGLWRVEVEIARQGGGWELSAPGLWAFKYALGGFAIHDLWYQGSDNLPDYMADLGRDYLLASHRIYDAAARKWRIAWMANGAGTVMGADFGTFTAELHDGDIVMTSTGGASTPQRVVFSEIGDASFRWRSEYSMNGGESWMTVMRMRAARIDGPP